MKGSRIYLRSGVYVDVTETVAQVAVRIGDASANEDGKEHATAVLLSGGLILITAIEAVTPR